jgi:5-methylcytosine-specific restriction endonuclease McrA
MAKAEARAAKLSRVAREGKDFTKAGKESVIDLNRLRNDGEIVCEDCGIVTIPATQSKKGVTPSGTERQVDHIDPKSKGGSGTPDNGQVLCRDCNIDKSDK